MKLRNSTLIIAAFLTLMSATASAQVYRRCSGMHIQQDSFSKSVTGMLFGELDTTGNRVEEKRVISTLSMQVLKKRMLELEFVMRDAVSPGKANVTLTDYMADKKFTLDGKKLKVKTRFRKYGTRDIDLLDGEVTPIEKMRDRSTMEFKIEHPNIENAVIKRQLTILDSDKALIIDPVLFKLNKNQIKKRLLQLNQGSTDMIDRAMDCFSARYAAGDVGGLDIKTTYDRAALRKFLTSLAGLANAKQEDVQVTFDSNIWFHDYKSGQSFRKYTEDEAIVEGKMPPQYLTITPQAIEERPALQAVDEVRKEYDKYHLKSKYEMNKGKSSSARSNRTDGPKPTPAAGRSDLEDLISE